jgi:hypothetical protein
VGKHFVQTRAEDRKVKELYSVLGVSEDDIVVHLRYGVIYALREGTLALSEEWVHRPIIERFRDYTHQNAIRVNRIAIDHDDCIVFDLRLVDPEIAIQEIVDDIYNILCEVLPWSHPLAVEQPWHEVRIFTIGDPESVEQDLTAYIEAVRRSKSRDDS